MSPLASGLVFTTMGSAFSVASLAAGRVARVLGGAPLVVGALGMAVGLLGLRLTIGWIGVSGSSLLLVPGLALEGAGMGLVMAPLAAAVLAGLPARDASAAAGVLVTVQQFANALGVALIGLVFFGVLGHAPRPASYASAFDMSLDCLIGLAAMLALLVRRLLRHPA